MQSFTYALQGLSHVLKTQHNAWVHAMISITVLTTASVLQISTTDWRWVMSTITLVWFAEVINTAFEYVCDVISPNYHPSVEKAKDIAAAAVLICSVGASTVGITTFWPYIQHVPFK